MMAEHITGKVIIWFMGMNAPVEYDNIHATYTNGPFYCLYIREGATIKYPLSTICKAIEDFSPGEHELVACMGQQGPSERKAVEPSKKKIVQSLDSPDGKWHLDILDSSPD